ncbi:MAG: T9SS type A sorting domain-containing protein, partial [Flavobacteriales bacterium]|nr:T9SS type A sorting domain-containing protein [Flavobacteriales bacterium]
SLVIQSLTTLLSLIWAFLLWMVTIPTVVHVIHNPASPDQNIPDSVIYSQIEVLNEDFRRMNADAVSTRLIFDSIAADIEVEFCLASFDTAGNPITGINRIVSTATAFDVGFGGMNDMKFAASGGADAWPRDQYLNIWVCNMTFLGLPSALLGFAQFPGDDPVTDGVVIQYNFMGRTNDPAQSDSSAGRTTTHEVGHWLGLRHIWADDHNPFTNVGTCDSSDFVDDTPNQEGPSNYTCTLGANSCSAESAYWGTTDPPDMVENFMDYSSDLCANLFSMGQKTRMLSFLNTDRLPLQSSPACSVVVASVKEMNDQLSLEIYPNPSSGVFQLQQDAGNSLLNVQIFDVMGQLVYKSNTRTTTIDLRHLDAGVYMLQASDAKASTSKRLLISK